MQQNVKHSAIHHIGNHNYTSRGTHKYGVIEQQIPNLMSHLNNRLIMRLINIDYKS